MERWNGRVALVTGGAAGIGKGVARCLAKHGMKVVACDINLEPLQKMQEGAKKSGCPGELCPVRCDVRNESEILEMFKLIRSKYGRLDVCVNNAGVAHVGPGASMETEKWKHMLDLNVLGYSICSREAIKLMKECNIDDGQIVNLNSTAGYRVYRPATAFYAATKHALRALTEGLRGELSAAKSGIRVSSVSPGPVASQMLCDIIGCADLSELPIKPLPVDDVVEAVVYILSTKPHVLVQDILISSMDMQ